MRIITKGALPDDELFVATCRYCRTEFEFKRGEATAKTDRNYNYLSIQCPLCRRNVLVGDS